MLKAMANPLSYAAVNLAAQMLNVIAGIAIARAMLPDARGELGIVLLAAGAIGAVVSFSLDSATLIAGPRFRSATTLRLSVVRSCRRLLPLIVPGAAAAGLFLGWRLGWHQLPLLGLLATLVAVSMTGFAVALSIPKARFDRRLWLQGRLLQGVVQLLATLVLCWFDMWLISGFLVITAASHAIGTLWI